MLATIPDRLVDHYDVALLDLDGVVYIGGAAVPGAAAALAAATAEGLRVAFITNNAARPPEAVAAHLTELGIPAGSSDVVTSAQAAAAVLRQHHGEGARVVMLGGAGLRIALAEAGLEPVGPDDDASAVVTGYGPDVRWRDIMRVAVRVRDGLPWVASNSDGTIPTTYGVAPGHGVLVETIARFAGIEPTVAGKPQRPLLEESVRRMAAERPLMVGDRLDTDIEGARNLGIDSLLVLTGVTRLAELVAAPQAARPTYLAPDLHGLLGAHPVPSRHGDGWRLGGWHGRVDDGRLLMAGAGDIADWWRVAATASWEHADRSGAVADITGVALPGTTPADR